MRKLTLIGKATLIINIEDYISLADTLDKLKYIVKSKNVDIEDFIIENWETQDSR